MSQPASRLITLIMLLQRQPNQKAAALAKTLGVSVRTLHRYFNALDEMGIPVYTERGPNGGFSLVRGYRMPPLVFSPEEAASLYLGTSLVENIWGSLYRDAAASALAKLETVLPADQQREVDWARRTMVAAGMRHSALKAAGPILETLRRCIKELTGVRITYMPGSQFTGGGPQVREVEPYALVHRWGWWYLAAFCRLRGGLRTFRVDRIRDAQPNGKAYEIPADFDIHAYLNNVFQNEDRVTVTMRFAPESAQTARANSFSWEQMEEQGDGSVVVRFSVPDLGWAASAVLGYGRSVRVLEPPALISTLREWLQAIAAHYAMDLPGSTNKEN